MVGLFEQVMESQLPKIGNFTLLCLTSGVNASFQLVLCTDVNCTCAIDVVVIVLCP